MQRGQVHLVKYFFFFFFWGDDLYIRPVYYTFFLTSILYIFMHALLPSAGQRAILLVTVKLHRQVEYVILYIMDAFIH